MQTFAGLLESHKVVETFVKGLYGMAVSAGLMTAASAEAHRHTLAVTGQRQVATNQQVSDTGVIINQQLAMSDRSAAMAESLARNYDELVVLDGWLDLPLNHIASPAAR